MGFFIFDLKIVLVYSMSDKSARRVPKKRKNKRTGSKQERRSQPQKPKHPLSNWLILLGICAVLYCCRRCYTCLNDDLDLKLLEKCHDLPLTNTTDKCCEPKTMTKCGCMVETDSGTSTDSPDDTGTSTDTPDRKPEKKPPYEEDREIDLCRWFMMNLCTKEARLSGKGNKNVILTDVFFNRVLLQTQIFCSDSDLVEKMIQRSLTQIREKKKKCRKKVGGTLDSTMLYEIFECLLEPHVKKHVAQHKDVLCSLF